MLELLEGIANACPVVSSSGSSSPLPLPDADPDISAAMQDVIC